MRKNQIILGTLVAALVITLLALAILSARRDPVIPDVPDEIFDEPIPDKPTNEDRVTFTSGETPVVVPGTGESSAFGLSVSGVDGSAESDPPKEKFTVTDVSPAITMYVNDNLNVRKGAGTGYDKIGMLYWASPVEINGKTDNGWYRITYGEEEAYICGDYVQDKSPVVTSPVVFVGDSRTVGMKNAAGSNNYTWIAEVGMGYDWLTQTAAPLIEVYSGAGTKLVFNMGVNDLRNVDKYAKYINNHIEDWSARGVEVYYVSVNPVIDGSCNASNAGIASFNDKLKNSLDSRVTWIDSNAYITEMGYSTLDGLHYTKDTTLALYAYYLYCIQ
ncbi:MAG: SH3 domain-containing protein [Lachnospiraceae bacterium]|nr:SH3 domain-containing protein [Lachnospiraceae bacterium]